LENTNRAVTEDEKVESYVQMSEYWFEDDDAVNAEKFISKAAHFVHRVQDKSIVLRYKVCHSRIMDSKRKFIIAASSYYDLSLQDGVDPSDLMQLLGMALTCSVLAPAGP
jgi:COP9 signalosome complex subunit 4